MNLTILWCGSLNGCFVLATISRASNLFFWLFISSSTLKNPAQYKTIPNAEMVVEKDGKRWFWADVIFMRNNLIKQALFIWRLGAWACYLILVRFWSFSIPSYIIRWQSSKILSFLAYVWQKRSILSTKGDILAYAVSGSDIPTVLLLLTAGNIFSTCIVLQNVSVYWTEVTFERTL